MGIYIRPGFGYFILFQYKVISGAGGFNTLYQGWYSKNTKDKFNHVYISECDISTTFI